LGSFQRLTGSLQFFLGSGKLLGKIVTLLGSGQKALLQLMQLAFQLLILLLQ